VFIRGPYSNDRFWPESSVRNGDDAHIEGFSLVPSCLDEEAVQHKRSLGRSVKCQFPLPTDICVRLIPIPLRFSAPNVGLGNERARRNLTDDQQADIANEVR
jgi:hypothetical protein